VSAIVTAFPSPEVSLGTVSIGRDDRPETGFGVLSGDLNPYSIGADYVPREAPLRALTGGRADVPTSGAAP
jgi:hypothetical protein